MHQEEIEIFVVHADESCLGNGRDGKNPGGAASLIERKKGGRISRQDLYLSSPDTTNNRMALFGAITTLKVLTATANRLAVTYVSDSQYLVKGMTEWVWNWRSRGWKRKGGSIENLELWKELVDVCAPLSVNWVWVRGHAGHAKNEYVDNLAVRAASEQLSSGGLVPSGLQQWLADKQRKGQFVDYDIDLSLRELEAELTKNS